MQRGKFQRGETARREIRGSVTGLGGQLNVDVTGEGARGSPKFASYTQGHGNPLEQREDTKEARKERGRKSGVKESAALTSGHAEQEVTVTPHAALGRGLGNTRGPWEQPHI